MPRKRPRYQAGTARAKLRRGQTRPARTTGEAEQRKRSKAKGRPTRAQFVRIIQGVNG